MSLHLNYLNRRLPFVLALALAQVGCVYEEDKIPASAAPTTTTTDTTASVSADLYLKIQSAPETSPTTKTLEGTCSVPLNTAPGSSTTCSVAIPEGDLYYSELTFTGGTSNSTACPYVVFQPYYYRASLDDGYIPAYTYDSSASSTLCATGSPTPAACWDGPATRIVPSFPAARSLYFPSYIGQETTYTTLVSAHSLLRWNNTFTSNTLVSRNADISNGIGQIYEGTLAANRMVDYVMECRDRYWELIHTLTVTIDSTPGATNDYPDWED